MTASVYLQNLLIRFFLSFAPLAAEMPVLLPLSGIITRVSRTYPAKHPVSCFSPCPTFSVEDNPRNRLPYQRSPMPPKSTPSRRPWCLASALAQGFN